MEKQVIKSNLNGYQSSEILMKIVDWIIQGKPRSELQELIRDNAPLFPIAMLNVMH